MHTAETITLQEILRSPIEYTVLILTEHLGDIVACEPVLPYLFKHYRRPIVFVTKHEYVSIHKYHPCLEYILPADSLSEAAVYEYLIRQNKKDSFVINLHFSNRICTKINKPIWNTNRKDITCDNYYHFGSILESFTMAARMPVLHDPPHFYLAPWDTTDKLPKHYITMQCVSNEEERDWTQEKWNALVLAFIQKEIHCVELGLKPVITVKSPYYHDRTSCHDIQTIAWYIKKSRFFIGIDSSFAHIANALSIPGLVLMGKYRDFTQHIPFTGFYRNNILRIENKPVASLSVVDVLSECIDRMGGK